MKLMIGGDLYGLDQPCEQPQIEWVWGGDLGITPQPFCNPFTTPVHGWTGFGGPNPGLGGWKELGIYRKS